MSKVSDRRKGILGSVLTGGAGAPSETTHPTSDSPSAGADAAASPTAALATTVQRRSYMGGLFTGEAAGLEARMAELTAKYQDALVVKKIDPAIVDRGPFRNRLSTSYDRSRSEAFGKLAEQIKTTGGNVDPVCVRIAGERFEIIYGYRRWQACLQDSLPLLAIVFDSLSDEEAMVLQYFENQSRESPSVVELGRQAADWLKGIRRGEHQKVAAQLGVSPGYLSNLALIGGLPESLMEIHPDVQTMSFRAARTLAVLHRDNPKQLHERLQQLRRKTPIPSPAEATAFLVAGNVASKPAKASPAPLRLRAEVKDGVFAIPTRELSNEDAKRLVKVLQEAAKNAGFDISV